MELIISLIAGAIGGNAAGKAIPALNQGTLINSYQELWAAALGELYWVCWARLIWRVRWAVLPGWTSVQS
jgi:hypothetical protein